MRNPHQNKRSLHEVGSSLARWRRALAKCLPPVDEMVMHHLLTNVFGGTLRDLEAATLERLATMPVEEAFDLPEARNADGFPGLFTAISNGMADAIAVHCDIARECNLEPKLKVKLLAARSTEHGPALFAGMQAGRGEAARALIVGIAESGLGDSVRAELLAARSPEQVPALAVAMKWGHAEAVQAFVEGLARVDLPASDHAELLAGRALGGLSALAAGIEQGNDAAALALLRGIAESDSLGWQQKQALLTAMNADGFPALAVALRADEPGLAASFVETVARSGMPADAMVELLLAKSSDGVPALLPAMFNDRHSHVAAFVETVLSTDLPASVKIDVLQARWEGRTALSQAAEEGSEEAAGAYRNAVLRSNLAPAEKLRLLDDTPRRRRTG